MSWSLHRGVATNFADGDAAKGIESAVWHATIPARAVLAMFGDERETEVVVNPNMLRARVILDEVVPRRALRSLFDGGRSESR
jgi:hypothetical protein